MVVFYVQFRVSSAYAIVQVVRIVEILKQEMKKLGSEDFREREKYKRERLEE